MISEVQLPRERRGLRKGDAVVHQAEEEFARILTSVDVIVCTNSLVMVLYWVIVLVPAEMNEVITTVCGAPAEWPCVSLIGSRPERRYVPGAVLTEVIVEAGKVTTLVYVVGA